MSMDAIDIEIPLPPKATHPNARPHWAVKMKAKARQRQEAHLCALAALDGKRAPKWSEVNVHATLYRNTGGGVGDPDNIIGWLKATVDGLQDAGIVANDRGVNWLAPSQIVGKAANGQRKIVLRLTPPRS